MSLTITARSKPLQELDEQHYCCRRCGITRQKTTGGHNTYCLDCLPEARRLGWAPPHWKKRNTA